MALLDIWSGGRFHRHKSSAHFYRVDAQLLKDDFQARRAEQRPVSV
jgi:hypothetical protein